MKLFKKVAAAILAGVMALSMVACAPANVNPGDINPGDIVIPPTSSTADEIVAYMNVARKVYGLTEIENNDRLAETAQIYLEAFTSKNADWNSNATNVTLNKDGIKALQDALNEKQLQAAGTNGVQVFYVNTLSAVARAAATAQFRNVTATKADLVYEVDDALKVSLLNFGYVIDTENVDIGVATVTAADGSTFALIVME